MEIENNESTEKIKPTRRKKKKQKSSHDIPHIDEKWLVSYSDMMTLLFGLFVMLYSMAIEKKGNMDAELKKIAEEGFQKKKDQVSPEVSQKNIEQDNSNQNEKVKQPIDEQAKQDLAKEQELEKQDLIKQKAQSLEVNKDLAKKMQAMQGAMKELLEQKKEMQNQIVKMQKTVVNSKKSPSANTFLIIARWEKEKHDIDLEIKSPGGILYNFKNKTNNGEVAAFLVDSTKGPGVEMFKTGDEKSGTYEVKLKLYNTRGDNTTSKVELNVINAQGEKQVEQVILTPEKREKVIYINKKDYLK
jgi:flagellar motor protein MotB